MYDRDLHLYVLQFRQRICLKIAASHSTYLQEFIAQPYCEIEIHVRLSRILICLQAKFSLFYHSYALFYQKKTPTLLVSLITTSNNLSLHQF
jgi:hypothetical protein